MIKFFLGGGGVCYRGRRPGTGRKNGGPGAKGKDPKQSGTDSEQEVGGWPRRLFFGGWCLDIWVPCVCVGGVPLEVGGCLDTWVPGFEPG